MTPLSADELQKLEDLLTQYGNDFSVIDASELDGFLTALISMPEAVADDEWLAEIWGDETTQPDWQSEAEKAEFEHLAKQHKAHLEAQFSSASDELILLFNIDDGDDDDEEQLDVSDWCFGYIRGLNMRAQYWTQLPELESQMLAHIYLFGSDDFEDELEALDDEQFEDVRNSIPSVAVHLYKHSRNQIN